MDKVNKVEFFLNDKELENLKSVVTELYKLNSIRSESLQEFLKLTVHIILNEWNSNNESLNKFYKQNESLFKNL